MAASVVVNSESFEVTTPSETAISMTRLFDAPKALLFEAMTKPEHVRQWWGKVSDEHDLIVCEIDLRVGGAWRYVGRGPRGQFAFHGRYREIAAPDRIVFTEIYEPFPDVESVVTTVLTVEGRKTRMTLTATYPSKDVRDGVLKSGMETGAAINFDRLEDLVRSLQTS